ncbi:MAG TPA: hypothetical protein VFA26_00225 [Gemmataceae bacterium]|nr:hypothetical protein [Gemmataceae bacterium]
MSHRIQPGYPLSNPYVPPEQLAAREAQLRRWTVVLTASALTTLALVTVLIVCVLSRLPPRRGDAPADPPEPQAKAPPAAPQPALPVALPQPVPPADRAAPPAPAPKEDLPPARRPPAADGAAPNEALLTALGSLLGAHLYQSYLNIGLLADGVEGEVYTVADAEKMLDAVADLMRKVDGQLTKLAGAGLKDEDRKTLEQNRKLVALLQNQAQELRDYWKTNDKEHSAQFQKLRGEAWAGIKDLLEIED